MASKQELWSNQFWQRLKSELSQRVKPSKSVLEALKHVTQLNAKYQQEQASFNDRIRDLEVKLKERQDSQKRRRGLKMENKVIEYVVFPPPNGNNRGEDDNQVEFTLLRGKIQHLEELLAAKESRYAAIADKEAVLTGQIDLLSLRNQSLQQRIILFEEMFSSQLKEKQQISESKHIEEDLSKSQADPFSIVINKASRKVNKQPRISLIPMTENEEEGGLGSYISRQQPNSSIMMSCTHAIQIEEEYDIERRATQKQPAINSNESLNQIDGILEAEGDKSSRHWIPDEVEGETVNVNASIVQMCMNNSIVDINLKQPDAYSLI